MTFQRSESIQTFLNAHAEHEWFWDFIHTTQPDDARKDLGDNYDDFDNGFELAKKAGTQNVIECDLSNGDLYLYFIGKEEEILANLKIKVATWLKKHPQEPPALKALAQLRETKMQAENKLKTLQADLASLEQQEAQMLATLPQKRQRKKKS